MAGRPPALALAPALREAVRSKPTLLKRRPLEGPVQTGGYGGRLSAAARSHAPQCPVGPYRVARDTRS